MREPATTDAPSPAKPPSPPQPAERQSEESAHQVLSLEASAKKCRFCARLLHKDVYENLTRVRCDGP